MTTGNPSGVHVFSLNGIDLAYDGASGSLHVLDAPGKAVVLWAVDNLPSPEIGRGVESTRPASSEDPPAALLGALAGRFSDDVIASTWRELCASMGATLFCRDETLDACRHAEESSHAALAGLKSMCLDIAHDCNLACRYCFASTGTFGGARSLMTVEVGKGAVDFLIGASRDRRYLDVDFFGGEPLLAFDTVKAVVDYAREEGAKRGKEFRFTLTTNCTLLDDAKVRFLNDHAISLILSLDGRPEVHDRMRPSRGGLPTHAAVIEKARVAAESRGGTDYYIRGTYTKHNLDFDKDVKYLYEKGFRRLSLEPAVGEGAGSWEIDHGDLSQARQAYGRLVEFWAECARKGDPFEFYHFDLGLEHGLCRERRVTGCGAGYEYVAVTPEGDIYPCHQLVGQADYVMGDIYGGIRRKDLMDAFCRSRVPFKSDCEVCWARYLCGGGCHARAIAATGDLLKPDPFSCEVMKTRLEYALLAQYSLSNQRNK